MPPENFRQLTRDQFAQVLALYPFTRRIDAVHMHHTWKPDHADYTGRDTIVGMWRYHTQVNGWSDIAQHVSIAPDGSIWTGRDWNRPPASASGYNGSAAVGPFMFETIGNFDKGKDRLTGEQLASVVAVIALVQRHFLLGPESLRFHRAMTDQKTCPGTGVDRDQMLALVAKFKPATAAAKKAAAKKAAAFVADLRAARAPDTPEEHAAEPAEERDLRGATLGTGKARTIVYVHGIGNKPEPSILKCQWDHALFGFDLAERSRLAYWVNRGYYPDPSAGTCASGDVTELEGEPTGRGLSIKRHVESVSVEAEVAAITDRPDRAATLLAIAAKMEARGLPEEATETEKAVAGVRATALPFPRWMREWITRRLVRAFVRDVNDFFYDDDRRALMLESLRERLRVGGGPFVVIGHSQGSMIAYSVLCELDPAQYQVDLFLTIGSPLGITEVQDNIRRITGQRNGRLAIPGCVRRWLNVADPLDPVALDKALGGEYRGNAELRDLRVRNPDAPRHPHSGSGYLSTREVREAVKRTIETGLFQRVAPFVIARDMARRLENHPSVTRHKVLIELALAGDGAAPNLAETGTRLEGVLRAIAVERGTDVEDLKIDRMQRYLAAELTREETEMLAQRGSVRGDLLQRIWRNSTKRALLDRSCQTVQARTAHAGYGATGRNIGWAVLDTGIVMHPHFRKQNIVAQVDCTRRGGPRPGATDENGHGTHVAGIIAGLHRIKEPDGSERVFSGLAPDTQLHVYKTLNKDGEGDDAWIIKALDHIAQVNEDAGQLRIHGVNLSLGGSFDQSVYGCGHTPLCRELRRLWRQGVVVVLAAGNEGFAVLQTLDGTIDANMDLSIGDPANLEDAIAVGSVHKESPQLYGISWYSSRGPTADGRQKPDLVAPGERILSCRHDFVPAGTTVPELYVEMSGTSMAAPHVSGLIAGFLSVRPGFIGDPDLVKRILLDNCTDLKRDRAQQGAGLANLTKMLLNT